MRNAPLLTEDGKDLIEEWIGGLKDRKAVIAIDRRIQWVELGNSVTTSLAKTAYGNCAFLVE